MKITVKSVKPVVAPPNKYVFELSRDQALDLYNLVDNPQYYQSKKQKSIDWVIWNAMNKIDGLGIGGED